MNNSEVLNLMEVYASRLHACTSTSGRHSNFKKMLKLWEENPIVREVWNYIQSAFLLVERFVKKTIDKCTTSSSIIYSCDKIEGKQLVYLIRLLDKNNNLVWSKIGTTTRNIQKRMQEHLRYYHKYNITTIEVIKIWNCGDIDAEGLESFLRAKYISKFPGAFQKNDRFYHVEFNLPQTEEWVNMYINIQKKKYCQEMQNLLTNSLKNDIISFVGRCF